MKKKKKFFLVNLKHWDNARSHLFSAQNNAHRNFSKTKLIFMPDLYFSWYVGCNNNISWEKLVVNLGVSNYRDLRYITNRAEALQVMKAAPLSNLGWVKAPECHAGKDAFQLATFLKSFLKRQDNSHTIMDNRTPVFCSTRAYAEGVKSGAWAFISWCFCRVISLWKSENFYWGSKLSAWAFISRCFGGLVNLWRSESLY